MLSGIIYYYYIKGHSFFRAPRVGQFFTMPEIETLDDEVIILCWTLTLLFFALGISCSVISMHVHAIIKRKDYLGSSACIYMHIYLLAETMYSYTLL